MTEHFEYERPTITEIGTLHELTLQNKYSGSSDGVQIGGIPVGPTGISLIVVPN